MNALHFLKLIYRNLIWVVLIPIICAFVVFYLTKNEKKEYTSNTTLYTGIASGYSITSTEDQRIDYFAINNAFDNLLASAKSRETLEEVVLRLLAEHLALSKPNTDILGFDGFDNLQKLAGQSLINKAHELKDTSKIYAYINDVYHSKVNNIIEKLINSPQSFYNINALKSDLIVTRINSSDLIQVAYTCSDPAVCQRILQLHSDIFNRNYRRIKSDQTFSAVKYFENKLAEVRSKLRTSEEELKNFGKRNKIINYYEQTRYIAESKEGLSKDIYEIKVEQNASKNALSLVEKKLNNREKQIANSSNMVSLRQKISSINAQLEKAKIYGKNDKVKELLEESQKLEDSIRFETNRYINLNYTLETVPRQNLIQEWVNNAINYDKSTAGLDVLNNQKQEYLDEIDEFAPLGSTLKRLDRQIDINEKEFLSILHGLNLARLRQSNISLNSNIVVQDKPFFPLEPLPSTRKLLIIVAFMVSFLLTVSVIIGRDVLDSSIKTPTRAQKIIGLPLVGISTIKKNIEPLEGYQKKLKNILTEQFIGTLLKYLLENQDKQQVQIGLFSFKDNLLNYEDIDLLHYDLVQLYPKLKWVIPQQLANSLFKTIDKDFFEIYTPRISDLNCLNAEKLVNKNLSDRDLIIHITPNLITNGLPIHISRNSSVNILVFSANDTWMKVHETMLQKLNETLFNVPLLTWLIDTHESNIDTIIGEIPKKRSWLRQKIRKIISLNLH